MHTGSEKCRLAQVAIPLKASTEAEYKRMKQKGKKVVVKNVALALARRGLQDICGLEQVGTKLMHTDIDCTVLEQYWIHEWAYLIWARDNARGYTRAAYQILEELKSMSIEDREIEIGLLMLNING